MMDNEFWRFSLDRYGRAGVPALCLQLQDRHRADVNLLLFALWLGSQSLEMAGRQQAGLIAGEVLSWHAEIVKPLRDVRRRMKGWPMADTAGCDRLRERVKAVELGAEQIEQAMLHAFFVSAPGGLWHNPAGADPEALMARNAMMLCGEDPAAEDTIRRLVSLCL
ncbi:TIGR02444 family protein (plasmid) [Phyllobacteriaceae bacterium JZ32]